jgi:uncharacterized protein (UPF0147 family)
MTHAIKLHTHLAPRRNIRRLTEEEIKYLLVRTKEEIRKGDAAYAASLLEEVIEALR